MTTAIKVAALATEDGWAIIRENQDLFLLRPPYTVSSKIQCTEKELEEAVVKHGFRSVDYSFSNYSQLIRFIKDEYIKANKKSDKTVPTLEELKELLGYASEDVLIRLLDRAETELIPGGKIEAAESLALDLMKLDKIIGNKKLLDRVIDIIYKCAEHRKKRKAWETKLKKRRLKNIFINIWEKYPVEQIMEKIETTHNRGVVFSLP
jgi:hypothetical protein